MNIKTVIKLILTCLLTTTIVVGCPIVGCLGGTVGLIIGMFVAYILLLLVFIFCLPKWFKDCIDEYWQKQEEKNVKKTK